MSFSTRCKDRERVQVDFSDDPGLTEQSHVQSCDMRRIMARSLKTGLVSHINQYQGQYLDLPTGLDFQEAQNIIAEAKSMFETVPAEVRALFGNDPARYLDFMQDEDNYDKIAELGLDNSHLPEPMKKTEPAAPDEVTASSGDVGQLAPAE